MYPDEPLMNIFLFDFSAFEREMNTFEQINIFQAKKNFQKNSKFFQKFPGIFFSEDFFTKVVRSR